MNNISTQTVNLKLRRTSKVEQKKYPETLKSCISLDEFKDLLDEVSVSLNSDNYYEYNEICNPKIENAYDSVKEFIKSCVKAGIKTTASVVTGFDNTHNINIKECEKIAQSLGAEFRNREYIENGY